MRYKLTFVMVYVYVYVKWLCRHCDYIVGCAFCPYRLVDVDLIIVNEGNESNDFWNLAGDRSLYHSLTSGN